MTTWATGRAYRAAHDAFLALLQDATLTGAVDIDAYERAWHARQAAWAAFTVACEAKANMIAR